MNFFLLALLLGIKHSFDPDHIIAVSNLLSRVKSLRQSAWMAASWAVGHMVTAAAVSAVLYAFRDSLLSFILGKFSLIVGVMLIVLGIVSLAQAGLLKLHLHAHRHMRGKQERHEHLHSHLEETKHFHSHMFGIGIIHGLASNDELLVLITSALGASALRDVIVGVGVFSAGVVIGMVVFSLFIAYPIVKISREDFSRAVNAIAGIASVAYGSALLLGLA